MADMDRYDKCNTVKVERGKAGISQIMYAEKSYKAQKNATVPISFKFVQSQPNDIPLSPQWWASSSEWRVSYNRYMGLD